MAETGGPARRQPPSRRWPVLAAGVGVLLYGGGSVLGIHTAVPVDLAPAGTDDAAPVSATLPAGGGVRGRRPSAPPLADVPARPTPSGPDVAEPSSAPSSQPTDPTACPPQRPTGWLATENVRAGTPLPARLRDGTLPRTGVLGYLAATDAVCGTPVSLHLGVLPGRSRRDVTVAAYRVGWYGGTGQRLVWRSPRVPVFARPVPSGQRFPHLVRPDWPASLTLRPDGTWPPGLYVLLPLDAVSGAAAGPPVPLVVGHPAGSAPLLFLASSLTWNAYGDFGGWSLYHGPKGSRPGAAGRARVVAVQRPLTGSGLDQFVTMDAPAVRTLERTAATTSGAALDADYATDVAVDSDPTRLARYAGIILGGHSEYWTTRMYDGLTVALEAGTNAAFLGANNLWWRTRLERDASGTATRQVVYRDAAEDPDTTEPTVKWDAATPSRDPASVVGQSHAAINVRGGYQLLDAPAWFLAGTSLTPGAVLPGVVGNEADGYNGKGRNPARTQVFAAGLLHGSGGPVLATASWTIHPSGAATFAAGTTEWACAPTRACRHGQVTAEVARDVAVLTGNVIRAFATARAGRTHPLETARDWQFDPRQPFPPAAIGRYGTGTADDETAE